MSSELQAFAQRYYGVRLQRGGRHGEVHHLYTPFIHPHSQQSLLLRTIRLPSHLRISDGIAENTSKKYHYLLAPLQIVTSDPDFQQTTYLVRAPTNIILLTVYLRIKQECHQPLEARFFLRFIDFVLRAHSILEMQGLPYFGVDQIGINQAGQFILCDPRLYFRNQQKEKAQITFSQWMQQLFRDFFKLPTNPLEHDLILEETFNQNYRKLCPLLTYLLSGRARKEETTSKMAPIMSRISEGASTISASSTDINDIMDRSWQESFKKTKKQGFKTVGKIGKIFVLLMLVAAAIGAGYFVYRFLHRDVICNEGFFLDSANQCRACSEGCTRCQDGEPNTCSKCEVNMYLVLNRQEQKQGYCLKECRGRIINMQVCIRDHPNDEILFGKVYNLSQGGLTAEFK